MASRKTRASKAEDAGGILTAEERILKEVHDSYTDGSGGDGEPAFFPPASRAAVLRGLPALTQLRLVAAAPAPLRDIMEELGLKCLVPRKRVNVMLIGYAFHSPGTLCVARQRC